MLNDNTLDRRICVRLPKPLVERITAECNTTNTRISDVVRTSLTEYFSKSTRRCR